MAHWYVAMCLDGTLVAQWGTLGGTMGCLGGTRGCLSEPMGWLDGIDSSINR